MKIRFYTYIKNVFGQMLKICITTEADRTNGPIAFTTNNLV